MLGVGNLLMSDEGFGVHVARQMEKMDLPEDVEVVEGGTDGFHLVDVVLGAKRLVIIDAIRGGGEPGSIYRFDLRDAPAARLGKLDSAHQVGMLEVLSLASLLGEVPETTFICVEPESLQMGMSLTETVERTIPRVIELVLEEITRSGSER